MQKEIYQDAATWTNIPGPVKAYEFMRLKVNKSGVVQMNRIMLEKLKGSAGFAMKLSPDGRYLAIKPDENGNIKFSTKGVLTHRQMVEMMEDRGVQMPASYQFEWCEEHAMYIGCNEELPSPPSAAEMLPPEKRRHRRAA